MTELLETWEAAGFVGPILAVCCALMWFGLGSRALALRLPRDLTPAALLAVRGGPTLLHVAVDEARDAARQGRAQRGRLAAAVAPFHEAFARHAGTVRSAVAVAPLAGLLGTVSGMIETFDSLGTMELFTRGGGIGAGISEAMISTQMGLVVAVPGLLLGAALERRQARLADALDAVVDTLLTEAA
ncbi:MAG: MotA/TolQ/ExbB proton channel family protein [Alphaproteobacteria bacterium]|nr:MotA/TolQ/ExbB proton channel family protein [Alphaproteobacteria bacterium]